MRISTSGAFQQGLSMMLKLQSALDHTQKQITSGRKNLTPADDPFAAARALNLRESMSRLEQFERNSTMATNRLGYEESALQSAGKILQREINAEDQQRLVEESLGEMATVNGK